MPNPLSRVFRDKPFFFLSHDALFDEPMLALDILAVIHTWSHCESVMFGWIAELMDADSEVAYAMLNAISGSEARRAAVEGAAMKVLSKPDFELFQRVDKETRGVRKLRNKFAHGLWGSIPSRLPGHLILVQPEDLTDEFIYWSRNSSRNGLDWDIDYSKIEVYSSKELANIRLDTEFALILTRSLVAACTRNKKPDTDRLRRGLLRTLGSSPTDRRKSLRRNELAPQRGIVPVRAADPARAKAKPK